MLWPSREHPPDSGADGRGLLADVKMAASKAAAKSDKLSRVSITDAGKSFLPTFAIFIRDFRKHVLWYGERMTFF